MSPLISATAYDALEQLFDKVRTDLLPYQARILDSVVTTHEALQREWIVQDKVAGRRIVPACCPSPQPRIANRSGRVFCASCRQYLDAAAAAPEPLSDEARDGAGIAPTEEKGATE